MAALGQPPNLRVSHMTLGGQEFMVLSHDTQRFQLPGPLTAAERANLSGVVGGLTNEQIARARGRSVRTVANQLAALYRRFGVRSRLEAIALFSGAQPAQEQKRR